MTAFMTGVGTPGRVEGGLEEARGRLDSRRDIRDEAVQPFGRRSRQRRGIHPGRELEDSLMTHGSVTGAAYGVLHAGRTTTTMYRRFVNRALEHRRTVSSPVRLRCRPRR